VQLPLLHTVCTTDAVYVLPHSGQRKLVNNESVLKPINGNVVFAAINGLLIKLIMVINHHAILDNKNVIGCTSNINVADLQHDIF
jgi:hypothetical protein